MNKQRTATRHQGASAPARTAPPPRATQTDQTGVQILGHRLWSAAAALFGMLLVWAFLSPHDSTSVFSGGAQPQNLGWLLAGLLAACAAICTNRGIQFSRWDYALGGLALLWLVAVTLLAGRECNPRTAWNGFWQVVALAGCYSIARCLSLGGRTRAALVTLCVASCVAVATIGLHQVTFDFTRMRASYQNDPEGTMREMGVFAPPGSPERMRLENRLNSPEPFATYALANSLATSLSGGLLLMLGLGFTGLAPYLARGASLPNTPQTPHPSQPTLWPRIARWGIVGVGLCLVFLIWFLTRSRTAYIAVLVSLGYWFLLNRLERPGFLAPRHVQWLVGVCLAIVGLAGLWLFLNDRLVLSESANSFTFRLEYWYATLQLLKEHGLFGVGLGNFQAYYPQYKLERASETIADPHNAFLDIAATLSVPIALLTLVWIVRRLTPKSGAQAIRLEAAPPPTASSHTTDNLHSAPLPDALDRQLAQFTVWGAAVGGAACVLALALLSGFDLLVTLVAWTGGGIVAWQLWPAAIAMTRDDSRASPTIVAAATAMVVCLLASGSWQASGIAIPLLVLLANSQPATAGVGSSNPQRGRRFSAVVATVGFASFVYLSWLPAVGVWTAEQELQSAQDDEQALAITTQALQDDPFNTEPLQWRVDILVRRALLGPSDRLAVATSQAEDAMDEWLSVDFASFLNWKYAGERLLELAAQAHAQGQDPHALLERSLHFYTQAASRFPSDVELQLQVALTAYLTGDREIYRLGLEEAYRLSEQSPHDDKKLETQTIWLPLQLGDLLRPPLSSDFPPFPAQVADHIPAEPVANWLRKTMVEPTQ
ncbi:O-antigen ligase family protein [Aureliella helgolandensis]|uniref:O-Antigen ligase n=1 Tax=Aureliella helgolandensis TaxID=2527968 RepID=A0A518GHG6_9BACT|nr:O-antigen ligase family protein [Aureliella helgolandensis]QDV28027.1 O-Antigen ligase [Aureliella helgolandensis]